MRSIVADWGTTRFRGYLVENGTILDGSRPTRASPPCARVSTGTSFCADAGPGSEAEPQAPVLLVGMVGSREGWVVAPYADCPGGRRRDRPRDDPGRFGNGRQAHIVPGLFCEPAPGAADVMRGEETLVLGAPTTTGSSACPEPTRNGYSCAAGGSSASRPT